MKGKSNKYHAQPCYYNNIKFDSKKERDYYMFLSQEKRDGHIFDFKYHEKIELIPAFTYYDGDKKRSLGNTTYEIDFIIYNNGQTEFLEIKGGDATKTVEWRLKAKLLKYMYRDKHYKFTVIDK